MNLTHVNGCTQGVVGLGESVTGVGGCLQYENRPLFDGHVE